ncbi:MAG: class I SAM-dependent methyltransferase [Candidatus Sericytochromatia bacterium]|nr:class I SAM-dependent methyltransferase [Candidatus Tanganyikabacteria bacterium]
MPSSSSAPGVDWESYAVSYDAVTRANPAYRALVARVETILDGLGLAASGRTADLACGTGTFTRLLLERVPAGTVFALDRSEAFLAHLSAQLGSKPALRALRFDMDTDPFPEGDLDLVISIHALCHARDPGAVLRKVHGALKPGGTFIVADIGRPLDLAAWSRYLVGELGREYARKGWGPLGALPALAFLMRHRKAAAANRAFEARQKAGLVWMHSLEEFVAALEDAGFAVHERDDREYRGIDSFAVARRPEGI